MNSKEFKDEKSYNNNKKDSEKMPTSPWIVLGAIFLLALLFSYPSTPKQYFGVLIGGDNENAVVSDIGFGDINRPTIDLFSRTNPQGAFNLHILATNETGNIIINFTLYNLGIGESDFPVSGNPVRGNITIDYSLYYGESVINQGIINKEVISDA